MDFLSLGIWGLKPMGKVEVPFNFQENNPRNVEGFGQVVETLKPSCHTFFFVTHFYSLLCERRWLGAWVVAIVESVWH